MTRHLFWIALALPLLVACRGQVSDRPPIHIVGDMDWQPKYHPQGESAFFADGRAARTPPAGTVAHGRLKEDDAFYRGKKGEAFVAVAPIEVDRRTLERGRERYDIYCSACHGRTGAERGIVVQRGYPLAQDLTSERVRGMPDGEIFDVISHGVRNMPGHGHQISEQDRWAIVAWTRVLQRAAHANLEDVPAETRRQLER